MTWFELPEVYVDSLTAYNRRLRVFRVPFTSKLIRSRIRKRARHKGGRTSPVTAVSLAQLKCYFRMRLSVKVQQLWGPCLNSDLDKDHGMLFPPPWPGPLQNGYCCLQAPGTGWTSGGAGSSRLCTGSTSHPNDIYADSNGSSFVYWDHGSVD